MKLFYLEKFEDVKILGSRYSWQDSRNAYISHYNLY